MLVIRILVWQVGTSGIDLQIWPWNIL